MGNTRTIFSFQVHAMHDNVWDERALIGPLFDLMPWLETSFSTGEDVLIARLTPFHLTGPSWARQSRCRRC